MKRALLSVSDKTGIVDFAKALVSKNFEIISTGNTKVELEKAGVPSLGIEDITNFPEIMEGRVKTLHPSVHSALLCDYDKEEHKATIKDLNIEKIDVVCVNLYPFEENLKQAKDHSTLIEKIDIGGPTMIRAAAKNYKHIVVCSKPSHYSYVLENVDDDFNLPYENREFLAKEAFQLIAHYDHVINSYFQSRTCDTLPETYTMSYENSKELRYGLNPFQQGKFYYDEFPINQLQGKQLSYNNYLDIDAILKMIVDFDDNVCVAVKHLNPCGIAFGDTVYDSYVNTYNCDSISIFGGIIAVKKEIDKKCAEEMVKTFLEVILAPSFSDEALEVFKSKKNLRVATYTPLKEKLETRTVLGGLLVQEMDRNTLKKENMKLVTKTVVPENIYDELIFADTVCKHVMSNGIVITKNKRTVGVGIGQTNRVLSAKIALEQAREKGETDGLILASDAFFPFDDCVKLASEYGVSYIVQPGGSIKDEEVIKACDEKGIGMIMTGERHFKH